MGSLAGLQRIRDGILSANATVAEKSTECALWAHSMLKTTKPMSLKNLTENTKVKFGFYYKGAVTEPIIYQEYKNVARDKSAFKTKAEHEEAIKKIITRDPRVRGYDKLRMYIAAHNDGKIETLKRLKNCLPKDAHQERSDFDGKIFEFKTSYLGIFSNRHGINSKEVGLNI